MPIHDWTRVRANRFHDFHQGWTVALCNALNTGLLPPDFFALVEQSTSGPEPNVIALERTPLIGPDWPDGPTVAPAEANRYANKANRVIVRHRGRKGVAVIEIVSPGNKTSRDAIDTFALKAVEFLTAGVHLLIIDLFPPGQWDPQGIHKVIWDHLQDDTFMLPPDKPLTLAAYSAGPVTAAYLEPVAVGDPLADMPLFLTPENYVRCPLEATYGITWDQYPAVLKGPLEEPPLS